MSVTLIKCHGRFDFDIAAKGSQILFLPVWLPSHVKLRSPVRTGKFFDGSVFAMFVIRILGRNLFKLETLSPVRQGGVDRALW